jgi:glutamate-ammonia-ligase adenylyltransferase
LKLGPGGLTDVEWLVQLMQMQFGASHPDLQTVSTLDALQAAWRAGLIDAEAREQLEAAWQLASEIRSAAKLWSGKANDALPRDRAELEGIAGVLGMPRGHTTELEERWLAASRRARAVFEREFFGYTDDSLKYPVITN